MVHLIDVIIPMYNRADYVVDIISELEQQIFKNFRAIFVDDGSKDNTLSLLQNHLTDASFDYEIIKKENGGAASARNAGIREATAPWIAFVDSDDGLNPHFLEYMYAAVCSTNADLAICNLKMFEPGAKAQGCFDTENSFKQISPAEAMKIFCTKWIGPVCLLISRELQQANSLFFDENCIYNEDAPFITEVIFSSQKVVYLEQELYFYYTHAGSLHRSPSLNKFLSAVKSFSLTEQKLLKSNLPAAIVFNNMGSARFYVATLRRAAVQLSYSDFKILEKQINFKRFRKQIKNLLPSQRIACHMLLISKFLFFHMMKSIFKD